MRVGLLVIARVCAGQAVGSRRFRGRGLASQARSCPQPLKGGEIEGRALPEETNTPPDEIEMSPEQASDLLKKLDFSVPFYYTREKRQDPFVEMQKGRGDRRDRRRGWRFWARRS